VPEKLYFRQGSLPVALRELKDVYHAERVLIVTDETMLHSDRLELLTSNLHELGLDYAVNSKGFAYDCVIFCGSTNEWQYLPPSTICVIIPTQLDFTDVFPWLSADMVILDEDMICDETPVDTRKAQILQTVRESLHGELASDYTLAWAVQAIRLVKNGGNLLHAAALAGLAKANAEPITQDEDLTFEAAEALGMTQEELTAFLNA
jgi:alcohol dehydrogenase class IV